MKKFMLLAALSAALYVQVNAQVIEVTSVPQPVVTSFQSGYPGVGPVVWTKNGTLYVADYKVNSADRYVTYDATGKLVEVGEGVDENSLPENAKVYVKTKYKGDHIKKVYKIKDANGVTIWKGKVKEDYVMFDENGNPMKMKRDD